MANVLLIISSRALFLLKCIPHGLFRLFLFVAGVLAGSAILQFISRHIAAGHCLFWCAEYIKFADRFDFLDLVLLVTKNITHSSGSTCFFARLIRTSDTASTCNGLAGKDLSKWPGYNVLCASLDSRLWKC
jgi:hypothetical protein